jgi:TRAP-type C4-dicarboxylate transport system permease large subunit
MSIAKLRNYPTYPRASFVEFIKAAAVSDPALMTPFIIVGGILLAWFTATESAAAAVIYAAVLSIFVLQRNGLRSCGTRCSKPASCRRLRCSASGTASVFGWLLAYFQIRRRCSRT